MKKTLVAALAAGLIFGGANVSTEAATTDSALSLQGTQLEIVEVMHHTPKGFGSGHRPGGHGPGGHGPGGHGPGGHGPGGHGPGGHGPGGHGPGGHGPGYPGPHHGGGHYGR